MVATATWAAFIDAKKITPSPSGCGGGSAPPPHDDDADDIDPPTASAGSPAVSAGSPAVSAASPAASAAGDAADTCEEATEARGASYTDSASQEPTGDRDTTSSEVRPPLLSMIYRNSQLDSFRTLTFRSYVVMAILWQCHRACACRRCFRGFFLLPSHSSLVVIYNSRSILRHRSTPPPLK